MADLCEQELARATFDRRARRRCRLALSHPTVLSTFRHAAPPSLLRPTPSAAAAPRSRRKEDATIFFSAHGVPVSYVTDAGDPYKARAAGCSRPPRRLPCAARRPALPPAPAADERARPPIPHKPTDVSQEEIEQCVSLIVAELKRRGIQNPWRLAYQSRVGPVEWLQPYTDATIREMGSEGVHALVAVPISFVSEHIETLEEIDCEYRELAHESGIEGWARVPALGVNATFIDDLADAVLEALPFVGSVAQAQAAGLYPSGPDPLVRSSPPCIPSRRSCAPERLRAPSPQQPRRPPPAPPPAAH